MDSKLNGFMEFRYVDERVRAGEPVDPTSVVLPRRLFGYEVRSSPSRMISQIQLDGTAGRDVDFANARTATGATVNFSASLRPTDHLEVGLIRNQRWLNVELRRPEERLFTARVSRVKATYTFTSRLFARGIAQYVSTDRAPALFIDSVDNKSGDFGGSLLLAYKLNWQSVLFVGYGDNRELTTEHDLARLDRQFFVKMSYAFQR
jgi:hypothetical protein